jgi:hypothetical protein
MPLVGSSRMTSSGLAQQGGGDAEALQHADREAAHLAVRRLGQADAFQPAGISVWPPTPCSSASQRRT